MMSTTMGIIYPTDYKQTIREFNAVTDHIRAISDSLEGIVAPSIQHSICEQVLVKLLTHCITLKKILPDLKIQNVPQIWDMSSIAAICRCIIEAHDAFRYIAAREMDDLERDFRIDVWQLHDLDRRLKMFQLLGSKHPDIQDLINSQLAYRTKIQQSRFYDSLKADLKKKIERNEAPPFLLSSKEMCEKFKLNHSFYNTASMYLSQHVHTFPFAINQLMEFKAGNEDSLRLLKISIHYILPFLSVIALETRLLFDGKTPDPPSRTRKFIERWAMFYSVGFSEIGV